MRKKQFNLFPILKEQKYRKNQVTLKVKLNRIRIAKKIINEVGIGKPGGRFTKIAKEWGVSVGVVSKTLYRYCDEGLMTEKELWPSLYK
tara:strand:- start:421 stop:687 length:267 start_codon:yes stop_codon:yes gene_type:complete